MRPSALWVLGFFVIFFAALGTAALLAWRAGYLDGQLVPPQASLSEVTIDGALLVRLHAQINDPSALSPSHNCAFSAVIVNQTPYQLLGARLALGSKTIDLPPLVAGHSANLSLWNIAIPQEQPSCLEPARRYQQIASQAKAVTCSMDGTSVGYCQRLLRVFADFDYPQLEADDLDAGEAAKAAIDAMRAGNLAVGRSIEILSGSFFKLGFAPTDVQKSDAAKALAAAEQSFDPGRQADIDRIDADARYATMGGPVTILQQHLDGQQVADWYKVVIWAQPEGEPRYAVIAWVSRDDLDKAHAKFLAAQR